MKVLAHVNRLQEKFYYVLNGLLIVFEQVAAPGWYVHSLQLMWTCYM